jgi:hypothetical protein
MNKTFYITIMFIIFLSDKPAFATLGGNEDSISYDLDRMSATNKTITLVGEFSNYSIKEITVGGTKIREYISLKDKVIFGIAWKGVSHPKLHILLGSHKGSYNKAIKDMPQKHRRRRHYTMRTQNMVVQKGGHQRSFRGRAYITSLIPDGVSADDIN